MGVSDIDYGRLAALIGSWRGDKGMDMSPEPEGTEENPYFRALETALSPVRRGRGSGVAGPPRRRPP